MNGAENDAAVGVNLARQGQRKDAEEGHVYMGWPAASLSSTSKPYSSIYPTSLIPHRPGSTRGQMTGDEASIDSSTPATWKHQAQGKSGCGRLTCEQQKLDRRREGGPSRDLTYSSYCSLFRVSSLFPWRFGALGASGTFGASGTLDLICSGEGPVPVGWL